MKELTNVLESAVQRHEEDTVRMAAAVESVAAEHGYSALSADAVLALMQHWREAHLDGSVDLPGVIKSDLTDLAEFARALCNDIDSQYELSCAVRNVPLRRKVQVTIEMEVDYDTPNEVVMQDVQTRLDRVDEHEDKAKVRGVEG